jgi:diguanylate cyclase (GGDEF)-like protein
MAEQEDHGLTSESLFTFFRELWEHGLDPFWVCENTPAGWVIVAANPAAQRVDPRQKKGARLVHLVAHFPEPDCLIAGYERLLSERRTVTFEQRPVIDDLPRLFETMLVPIMDAAGNITHAWGMSRDRTKYLNAYNELQAINERMDEIIQAKTKELEVANQKLSELSLTDALTGIANRRHMDKYLADEVRKLSRHSGSLAFILMDIDHFKRYNDSLGHLAGDEALRRVAAVLNASVPRSSDLIARYGGEEFAIILPDSAVQAAVHVVSRAMDTLSDAAIPHPDSPTSKYLTLSAGISVKSASDIVQLEDFILEADRALYLSKQAGRNRYTIAD